MIANLGELSQLVLEAAQFPRETELTQMHETLDYQDLQHFVEPIMPEF